MYMNKFITGAVVGGTIGAIGAMYALTSEKEKKMLMRREKDLVRTLSRKLDDIL
ncbi:MAG: hypothetical protein AB9856_04365 [Cellulosilyticaceae bacterium]